MAGSRQKRIEELLGKCRGASWPRGGLRTHRHILAGRQGVTLVELIVSFALAAIFMTAALALVPSFTNVYLRIINMNRIHDISSVVLEKVVDELSYASGYEGGDLILSDPIPGQEGVYSSVEYSDDTGNRVRMNADEERGLLLTYQEIRSDDEDSEILYPKTEWYLGSGMYKGNRISLSFEQVENTSLIKIYLEVFSAEGVYSQKVETYAECIDLDADDIKCGTEGS
jgi:hypothetical protein